MKIKGRKVKIFEHNTFKYNLRRNNFRFPRASFRMNMRKCSVLLHKSSCTFACIKYKHYMRQRECSSAYLYSTVLETQACIHIDIGKEKNTEKTFHVSLCLLKVPVPATNSPTNIKNRAAFIPCESL